MISLNHFGGFDRREGLRPGDTVADYGSEEDSSHYECRARHQQRWRVAQCRI